MDPSENCEEIVKNIKHSNLHYLLSENPFSLQITIRKKYIDNHRPLGNFCLAPEVTSRKLELEIEDLKKKLETKTVEAKQLDSKNQELKHELSDVSDELFNTKIELTKQVGHLKDSSDQMEKLRAKMKNLLSEKKMMIKLAEEKFEGLNNELKFEIMKFKGWNRKIN